jgi:hypothetical protein
MSLIRDLPTGTHRPPIGPADSLEEPEQLTFPHVKELYKELLAEPNRSDEVATQTQPFDQSGTFSVNGGSAATVSSFELMFSLPRMRPSTETFNVLQKWEGVVTEVLDDAFVARLIPIVGEGPDQEAEIYLDEIETGDQDLIEPGAMFYWSIGYLNRPSGRWRASFIRFRRLPSWTEPELEAAEAKAARLKSLLNDDSSA